MSSGGAEMSVVIPSPDRAKTVTSDPWIMKDMTVRIARISEILRLIIAWSFLKIREYLFVQVLCVLEKQF